MVDHGKTADMSGGGAKNGGIGGQYTTRVPATGDAMDGFAEVFVVSPRRGRGEKGMRADSPNSIISTYNNIYSRDDRKLSYYTKDQQKTGISVMDDISRLGIL